MAMLRRSVDLDVSERRHDVAIRVPCKKMKKRRELDALVAKSQKSLSAVYKSGGYPPGPHGPLLRNDSDSCSDLEGYPSVGSPKHQSACCKSSRSGMWVPAWLFLIVLIGAVVSATLLWLHIGLKQDFILLRNHLVKVDNDGKHVPDSLREIEQRLAHMRGNQSVIEQLVSQLSSRLDQISKNLKLVNGSAEKLRGEMSNTINEQMPSHFEKFNSSLVDVQTRMARVANGLVSASDQLKAVSVKQRGLEEAMHSHDTSISMIEDAISGKNSSSSLARSLNRTIETTVREAQANIESSIHHAQSELHAQMTSSLRDSINEMKRELSSPQPIEMKSVPLIASNTVLVEAKNNDHYTNENKNNGSVFHPGDAGSSNRNSTSSSVSEASTKSWTIESDVTTQSPSNALTTVT